MAKTSKSKREKVFAKAGGRCSYCGNKIGIETFHIDHLVPKWRGGSNCISNLLPACADCNTSKGHKPLEAWRRNFQIKKASGGVWFNDRQIEFLEASGFLEHAGIQLDAKLYFETIQAARVDTP